MDRRANAIIKARGSCYLAEYNAQGPISDQTDVKRLSVLLMVTPSSRGNGGRSVVLGDCLEQPFYSDTPLEVRGAIRLSVNIKFVE